MDTHKEADFLSERDFEKILQYILINKGVDISSYRKSFVLRRLRLRMWTTKSESSQAYLNLLKDDSEEYHNLLDTLGINVTEFFRDPEVFGAVRRLVLPELFQRKTGSSQSRIRIWSAACASGEEPFSIAILIKEELEKKKEDFSVSISATDMDKDALEKARKAEYREVDLKKLDKKTLEKYFIPSYNNCYKLKDEIRQMVNFHEHNLLTHEPLKFMDIIFCRNMMIYLARQQQRELLIKFNHALCLRGYFVVGKVENLTAKELFFPVSMHEKIYQKVEQTDA